MSNRVSQQQQTVQTQQQQQGLLNQPYSVKQQISGLGMGTSQMTNNGMTFFVLVL